MSRNFSGTSIRRDKIRLADEEAVMFLQGSWGPNEVTEKLQRRDDSMGIFSMALQ